jgi:hypothetical protein
MAGTGGVRVKEIRPPSARAESLNVARALFHIGLWSAILISAQVNARGASPAAETLPFVRRFQDVDPRDQRMFRAIQEGIGEAERLRAATGSWPPVASLSQQGIPPFSPDPLDKDGYAWTFFSTRGVVNYVGTPRSGSGRETFLVIITEPDPGTPIDRAIPTDEIHHRLASGAMIHVSLFVGPGLPDQREPAPAVDFDRGWQQVLAGPVSVLGR